jgi:acyl carrier protein
MMELDKIKKILVEQLDVDEEAIKPETTIEELGADSLDLVEMIMNLEEEFGIQIEDDDMDDLKTVGDIIEYIRSKS